MRKRSFSAVILLCLCAFYSKAQNADTSVSAIRNLLRTYYTKVEDKLTIKFLQYLIRFEKQGKLSTLAPGPGLSLLNKTDIRNYNPLLTSLS